MRPRLSPFAFLAPFLAFALTVLPASSGLWAAPITASQSQGLALVNRLSWGETAQGDTLNGKSPSAWLEEQLHPSADDGLPPQVQTMIAGMAISRESVEQIFADKRLAQKEMHEAKEGTGPDEMADPPLKGHKPPTVTAEAMMRSLLRDLYSKNQLKEQLTWFWYNHFNVSAHKHATAFLVADYEERAIRPHVLGKFRDLLAATVFHPAMLQYLDNQQNAVGKINENYAREIMELHTMGVGSGYSQQDVQELARILTGVGTNLSGKPRAPAITAHEGYRADGFFEFDPRRHDFGDKHFLGHDIKGSGLDEVNQAIDILSREPATAHFVSRQLAQYFCCDEPSDQLVGAMVATWQHTDGDIAQILKTLFSSDEFNQSLGKKFKDPIHYAVSAIRATYGNQVIANAMPLVQWLFRMGEPFYGRETPEGYALTAAGWSGPGEMEARFEFARQIGYGAGPFFRGRDEAPTGPPPVPVLQETAYYTAITPVLSQATAGAIAQGKSQADRNMLLLSSPEFMRR